MPQLGLWLTTVVLALLAGCGALDGDRDAAPPHGRLSGVLSGPAGLELPPDAEAVVELHGALADDPHTQVAAARLDAALGLPLEFTLHYDPALTPPGGTYILSARIERLGRPLFVAQAGRLRLDPGSPRRVELQLRPAGQAGKDLLDAYPEELICEGSSPVWALRIRGGAATFSLLSEQGATIGPQPLAGSWAGNGTGEVRMSWRGSFGRSDRLTAQVERRSCLDAIPDGPADKPALDPQEYAVRVELSSGRILHGCCRDVSTPSQEAARAPEVPLTALAGRPDDWARYLADLLPAVQACLGKAGTDAGSRVTKAWPMNRGMVGVRGRTSAGRRWECIAPQPGTGIDSFEFPSRNAAGVPGEGRILFTPAGQPPPEGVCWSHERVVEGDSFVGWLSRDVC